MEHKETKTVSKAQQNAVNKYIRNNYDRINVTLPQGEKEVIQAAAKACNKSVNDFIRTAIKEKMERDNLGL